MATQEQVDELVQLLAATYAEFSEDEEWWSFDAARNVDAYGDHVIDRVRDVGSVLHVAAEDAADAVRRIDVHEARPLLRALVLNWHNAAESLDDSRRKLEIRFCAELLRQEIDGVNDEQFVEAVDGRKAANDLGNFAVTWHDASQKGAAALTDWYRDYAEPAMLSWVVSETSHDYSVAEFDEGE